jgi:hypothetical protein
MTAPAAAPPPPPRRQSSRLTSRGRAAKCGTCTCVAQLRKSVTENRSNGGTTSKAKFGDRLRSVCKRRIRPPELGVAVNGFRAPPRSQKWQGPAIADGADLRSRKVCHHLAPGPACPKAGLPSPAPRERSCGNGKNLRSRDHRFNPDPAHPDPAQTQRSPDTGEHRG